MFLSGYCLQLAISARTAVPRISLYVLPSKPETNTAVKPITKLLLLTVLIVVGNSLLLAADRGTLVREAVIYLSPDTTSNKLAQAERGRELILLDKSHNWLHVEALLGFAQTPDPAFVLEDEDRGQNHQRLGSRFRRRLGVHSQRRPHPVRRRRRLRGRGQPPPRTPRRGAGRLAPLSPRLRYVPQRAPCRRSPLPCRRHSMADRQIRYAVPPLRARERILPSPRHRRSSP